MQELEQRRSSCRKDAFDPDHKILTVRSNQFEKPVGLSGDILMQTNFPFIVQDADIHHLGVQVDSAVIWVRSVVESHLAFLLFSYHDLSNPEVTT